MVWEGVPWMVDGGDHTAEVGRMLAYAATGGNEGIVAAGDCKVVAANIPDGTVHIRSGGIVALNRFPGGGQQSYILRNVGDEVKALDPQGSSGVRYDLVAVIVEDPQYPGQPNPPSEANGPYLRTAVYKNVGPTAKTLAEVDPDQTGVVLARVKFDASDGTITNADITDLRKVAMPKTSRQVYPVTPPTNSNLTSAAMIEWPTTNLQVPVPEWATNAVVTVAMSSFVHFAPDAQGFMRVCLGVLEGQNFGWDLDQANGAERQSFFIAGKFAISDAMQGTTQELFVKANRTDGTGYLSTWDGPMMIFDVTFTGDAV